MSLPSSTRSDRDTRGNQSRDTPDDSTWTCDVSLIDNISRMMSKRNKYTPTACTVCKKQKLKCTGTNPCQRCIKLSSECVYTPRGMSTETQVRLTNSTMEQMNEKIEKLQEQIVMLIDARSSTSPLSPVFTNHISSDSPVQSRSLANPTHASTRDSGLKRKRPGRPHYVGPTSSAFSFGVAKSSLQAMGMESDADNVDDGMRSNQTTPSGTPQPSEQAKNPIDAMSFISVTEGTRLIDVYEEESGTLYPFLDINEIKLHADKHYASVKPFSGQPWPGTQSSEEERMSEAYNLHLLRIVMAIASVIEGRGHSDLSTRLVDEVKSCVEADLCMGRPHIRGLQVLTLMSIYQFHSTDEVLAWRTIGLAVRAALEMGLHRKDTFLTQFHDQQRRLWVNKLFWCIYVLDRRWSLGVGMPFALHDLDIDPDLPKPDNSHPYLISLIDYGNIGSKVWKAMSGFGSSTPQIKKEKVAYLDFTVLQWQRSLPMELQLLSTDENLFDGHSRSNNRLKVMLYLRANQMKIFIRKRTLLTPATIMADLPSARVIVEIAQDSIQMIDKLNRQTDIYRTQQTAFNYFLVSALGIVFLAICHAPAHFSQSCRDEFFMALDLIKGFSGTSYAARRLWRTIKHLKVIGPKLGILSQQSLPTGADSDFGKRSAHLSGTSSSYDNVADDNGIPRQNYVEHVPGDLDFFMSAPLDSGMLLTDEYQLDGAQLSYELSNLFEAIEPRPTTVMSMHAENAGSGMGYSFDFGTEEDLSRNLIDIF